MTKEELEQKLEQTEKDLTDYQFNYPKIKDLEKEKCELLGIIQGKDKAIKDLEWQLKEVLEDNDNYQKENAELKEINEGYNRNRDKLIAMGFPTFKSCKEYSGKLTNLQKENTTLKKQLEALSGDIPWSELKDVSEVTKELTEAKDLLSRWIDDRPYTVSEQKDLIADTEQFLKEVEK